ncbi:hypothetical protein PsorP6_014497 [Peronosclerospora sorghi]|uniref:Uncharacterized protein n=1 Tax=Peronosclerospora sorghi TaxID=230839 RepID=A0ACC0VTJ9_9STRA|nr:hypothetical protein PsorP6_014497 [Peronosclerospora sorghi]
MHTQILKQHLEEMCTNDFITGRRIQCNTLEVVSRQGDKGRVLTGFVVSLGKQRRVFQQRLGAHDAITTRGIETTRNVFVTLDSSVRDHGDIYSLLNASNNIPIYLPYCRFVHFLGATMNREQVASSLLQHVNEFQRLIIIRKDANFDRHRDRESFTECLDNRLNGGFVVHEKRPIMTFPSNALRTA